jgi:hypothetical protein
VFAPLKCIVTEYASLYICDEDDHVYVGVVKDYMASWNGISLKKCWRLLPIKVLSSLVIDRNMMV